MSTFSGGFVRPKPSSASFNRLDNGLPWQLAIFLMKCSKTRKFSWNGHGECPSVLALARLAVLIKTCPQLPSEGSLIKIKGRARLFFWSRLQIRHRRFPMRMDGQPQGDAVPTAASAASPPISSNRTPTAAACGWSSAIPRAGRSSATPVAAGDHREAGEAVEM